MSDTTQFVITCDPDDRRDILRALSRREGWLIDPDDESPSCLDGKYLAEICRGWMEMHDQYEPQEPAP